jgi:hypothetical protein
MVRKLTGFGGRLSKPKKPAKPDWPKNSFGAAQNRLLAIEALQTGRCLTLTYHDCYRVAEVHTVGLTHTRRPAMSVYQVDGQANEATIPDWQFFCFDECFNVALSDLPSGAPRPKYAKGAKQFLTIDVQV